MIMRPCIRVAMVEDDPVLCGVVLASIKRAPDMVMSAVATSRKDALAMLAGPAADVLLADIGLPDGSGLDVVREAARRWPGCAVLVSTTFGDEAHVLEAISCGAAGYLLKDDGNVERLAEIRSAYQGGSPISPIIARKVLARFRSCLPARPEKDRPALSEREHNVLQLIATGFTTAEIASRLAVSTHTVLTYVRRIYQKLAVNSRIQAVSTARRLGWLDG